MHIKFCDFLWIRCITSCITLFYGISKHPIVDKFLPFALPVPTESAFFLCILYIGVSFIWF